ncbi:hypothetical protein E8E14_004255 [Neopestalotiopsis sp. 37M]|nr:hypothetical protein E8E14_004255 [Neopestalotiopsis sp. 37M]
MTLLVLRVMTRRTIPDVALPPNRKLKLITQSMRNARRIRAVDSRNRQDTKIPDPYPSINLSNRDIRLFKLLPSVPGSPIQGSFSSYQISECPSYIALSYTWGDQVVKNDVVLDNGGKIAIGDNLWKFLCLQVTVLTEPKYFWIDAICINQENVHERNHQVGMMKAIYAQASEVYVWLGPEGDDSNHAMEFMQQQSSTNLRTRGSGFFPLWDRRTAKALSSLCERPYWRRMWIIQELLHAEKIIVWCGTQKFDWSDIEALYLKLEKIENTNWFAHHELHMSIKQSAAATMAWQRAHWRHPDTPAPRLSRLIEIFRDWHCTDIRDKVFALVGMATTESAIIPDYALSTREVYLAVMGRVSRDKDEFANLLSQLLGVPGKDVDLWDQTMIEYKVQPSEIMVLRSRRWGNWK